MLNYFLERLYVESWNISTLNTVVHDIFVFLCMYLNLKDRDQWEKLSSVLGDSCSLLSDMSYKSQAPSLPGVRGRILKHINETTVSDLIHMASVQQGNSW